MFAALVSLRDEINVAFVLDIRRARVLFAEDLAGFLRGFDGNFEK